MTSYIDEHRQEFGVEPICTTLQVAPSSYYAAKSRPPSERARRDAALKPEVQRVYDESDQTYGAYKLWRQLRREGIEVGRDRVARLMRELGLKGVVEGRITHTTVPAVGPRPQDKVQRQFKAAAPNRLWVADLTYVPTWQGFVYVAFVTDAFSRRIVGWKVSSSLHAELALDALEMAVWNRGEAGLQGLVHHSDRGSQYLSIVYTKRLSEFGAVASVGAKGSSYDNALAENVNALYKREVIRRRRRSWRSLEEVELATLRWVDRWNHRRLHGACGDIPPAEFEAMYYSDQPAAPAA
jgi:putative transposase